MAVKLEREGIDRAATEPGNNNWKLFLKLDPGNPSGSVQSQEGAAHGPSPVPSDAPPTDSARQPGSRDDAANRPLKFTRKTVERFSLIRPDFRGLLVEICRQPRSPRRSSKLFPKEDSGAQRQMAGIHQAVLRWVGRHDGLAMKDERPNPEAFAKLQEIAQRSKSPIPLLYDLQFELRELVKRGEFPPQTHGFRAFDLCPVTRPVADSVALPVPLLELPPDAAPGRPLTPRAFMGRLKIEKVPVPTGDDGTRLWLGGHVYSAPVFAILDQDQAWEKAIGDAVDFLNSRLPRPALPSRSS